MPNLEMMAGGLGAAILLWVAPASAQAVDPFVPYFGNTFILLHNDGGTQ